MKIFIGNDYRGKDVRKLILDRLSENHNFIVTDKDEEDVDSNDYTEIASTVARDVSSGLYDRGILICRTAIGACVVANKFFGIRAALCHNEIIAELSRKHNDSNILCLACDMLSEDSSIVIVEKWLATPFESGRHAERLEKIKKLEVRNYSADVPLETNTSISSLISQAKYGGVA